MDCRDSNGWPPLLYAHFSGHEEAFLMLMEADPHQVYYMYCNCNCMCDNGQREGNNESQMARKEGGRGIE